jgi:hypothetical protein
MKAATVLLFGALLPSGLAAQKLATPRDPAMAYCAEHVADTKTCRVYGVSIVQLLSTPALFEGKRVQVVGFLHLEFEGDAMYLHREDYEAAITRNGLWVNFRPGMRNLSKLSDRYVLLEGVFTGTSRGHMGMWSGSLGDIDQLQLWASRADAVKEHKRALSSP